MNVIYLSNGHANALALSLIYDPSDENMLVATVLTATSSQVLEALKAQMEKNGGNILKALPDEGDPIVLTAAGHGYTQVKTLFLKANASGQARVHLHPLAGDPRLHPKPNYFYVAVEANTDPCHKFGQRLELATHHTILPDWYGFLFEKGTDNGLIESLPVLGEASYFAAGFRVLKDNDAWGSLITEGLQTHTISL